MPVSAMLTLQPRQMVFTVCADSCHCCVGRTRQRACFCVCSHVCSHGVHCMCGQLPLLRVQVTPAPRLRHFHTACCMCVRAGAADVQGRAAPLCASQPRALLPGGVAQGAVPAAVRPQLSRSLASSLLCCHVRCTEYGQAITRPCAVLPDHYLPDEYIIYRYIIDDI